MTNALIVGAGPGLSASLARLLAARGSKVALAARNIRKLEGLCEETGANAYTCDASDETRVEQLFAQLAADDRAPDLLVYNASAYTRGPIAEIKADKVREVLKVSAYGAFLVARTAAQVMLEKGGGTMLFTGASAGVKGYAQSALFAMGKFALRGLCQSLARELAPRDIHVAHFVLDGVIYQPERGSPYDDLETTLHPDAISRSYLAVADQDRSAWSWEVELRPYCENY